jgi:hypothetical protein
MSYITVGQEHSADIHIYYNNCIYVHLWGPFMGSDLAVCDVVLLSKI